MTDAAKIRHLRKALAPTIGWYRARLETHGREDDYLYDQTVEHLYENLTRKDAQHIIEILAMGYDPRPKTERQEQAKLI